MSSRSIIHEKCSKQRHYSENENCEKVQRFSVKMQEEMDEIGFQSAFWYFTDRSIDLHSRMLFNDQIFLFMNVTQFCVPPNISICCSIYTIPINIQQPQKKSQCHFCVVVIRNHLSNKSSFLITNIR